MIAAEIAIWKVQTKSFNHVGWLCILALLLGGTFSLDKTKFCEGIDQELFEFWRMGEEGDIGEDEERTDLEGGTIMWPEHEACIGKGKTSKVTVDCNWVSLEKEKLCS